VTNQTGWKFSLDGTQHNVNLSHDAVQNGGYLAIDGLLRRCFGPGSIPSDGEIPFEVDGRRCFIQIRLVSEGSQAYDWVIGHSVVAQIHSESSLPMTLLRPSTDPDALVDILVRPAFLTGLGNDDLLRSSDCDEVTSD
jgi:hypothetical protein